MILGLTVYVTLFMLFVSVRSNSNQNLQILEPNIYNKIFEKIMVL